MATTTLKPAALSTIVTQGAEWTTSTGTMADSWQLIDDISSDSDYISHDDTQKTYEYIAYDIGALPSDFVGADSNTTYTIRVRCSQTGYSNDITTLTGYLIGPTSTVTQGSASGLVTYAGVNGFNWTPSMSNSGFGTTATTHTYTGSILTAGESASTADWSNSKLLLRWEKNNQMGGDNITLNVYAIEIDIIDYVQSIATLSSPTATNIGVTTATTGVTSNLAGGTMYAYVSTNNTPPSAAILKAGTGAVWSSNQAGVSGVNTFNIPYGTLNPLTNYYTHFIQNNPGGDSNIISTTQWTTLDGNRTVACSIEDVQFFNQTATVTKDLVLRVDFSAAQADDILVAILASDLSSGNFTAQQAGWTRRIDVTETRDIPNVHLEVWTKTALGTEDREEWTGVNTTAFAYGEIVRGGNLANSAYYEFDPAPRNTNYQSVPNNIVPDSEADVVIIAGTVGGNNEVVEFDRGGERPNYNFTEQRNDLVDNQGFFVYNDTQPVYGVTAWAFQPDANFDQWYHKGAGTWDNFLAIAGRDNAGTIDDVQSFNGTSWTTETVVTAAVQYHCAAGAGESSALYFEGTVAGSGVIGRTESYNGTAWTAENSTSINVQEAGGSGLETAAFKVYGKSGSTDYDDSETFNGTTWTTQGTAQLNGLAEVAATGTQTAGLVTGGYSQTNFDEWDYTQKFNGTTWTYVAAMLSQKRAHWTSGLNTDAIVGGGLGNSPIVNYISCEEWNNTAWSNASFSMPYPAFDIAGGDTQATAEPFTQGGGYLNEWFGKSMAVQTTSAVTDQIKPFYQLTGSGEYAITVAVTIAKTPGEIYAFTEDIDFVGEQATIVIVPHTVIEIPPAENMRSRYYNVRYKRKPYKVHQRRVKPKWTRHAILGFEPTFDNTQPAGDRTVVATTSDVDFVNQQATFIKNRTLTTTTEIVELLGSGTVDLGRDVTTTSELLEYVNEQATVFRDLTVNCTPGIVEYVNESATFDFGRNVNTTTEVVELLGAGTVDRGLNVNTTTEVVEYVNELATIRRDLLLQCTTEVVELLGAGTVDRGLNINTTSEVVEYVNEIATIIVGSNNLTVVCTTEFVDVVAEQGAVDQGRDATGSDLIDVVGEGATIIKDRLVQCTTEVVELLGSGAVDQSRDVTTTTEVVEYVNELATLDLGRNVTGGTEVVEYVNELATVQTDRDVACTSGIIDFVITMADVGQGLTVQSFPGTMYFAEEQAFVGTGTTIQGVTEEVEILGQATVSLGRDILCTTSDVEIAGETASFGFGLTVAATTEDIEISGAAIVSFNRSVVCTTEVIDVVVGPAVVNRARVVTSLTAANEILGEQATVKQGRRVATTPEDVEIAGETATIIRLTEGQVEGITENVEIVASRALVRKMTIMNPLPDYRNIGIRLVPEEESIRAVPIQVDIEKVN